MSTRDDGHTVGFLNVMSKEINVNVWSCTIIIPVFPCVRSVRPTNDCPLVLNAFRNLIESFHFTSNRPAPIFLLLPMPDPAVTVFLQAKNYFTPGFMGKQLPALRFSID